MKNQKSSKKAQLLADTVTDIIDRLPVLRNLDQGEFEKGLNQLIPIIENKPVGRALRKFLKDITTGSLPADTDPKRLEDVINQLFDRLIDIKNSDVEDYNEKISTLRQRILEEIYAGAAANTH